MTIGQLEGGVREQKKRSERGEGNNSKGSWKDVKKDEQLFVSRRKKGTITEGVCLFKEVDIDTKITMALVGVEG